MPQLHGKQIKDASIENVKLIRPATRTRAKSTADVDISSAPAAIDGVTLAQDDRVLLADQSPAAEDGIYIFNGTGSAMTRTADYAIGAAVAACPVFVSEGTANADTVWLCTNNTGSDVVNTDDLVFVDVTGTGAIIGGDGIDVSGNTVSVDLSAVSGLAFNGGTLEVDSDTETGGDIRGVNLTANGVGLDIASIDGVGIDADGSGNLEIATQGDGITGGGGTVLAVEADGDTITVGAGGVKSITQNTDDKDVAISSPTSGDESDTGVDITTTPVGDRYVQVFVNGLKVSLGDAVKTKDSYFSSDGGTTARALSAIVATDDFIWNGVVAGYELDATDVVDFDHDVAA